MERVDLTKLSPAPWEAIYFGDNVAKVPCWGVECNLPDILPVATARRGYGHDGEEEANAKFIALARNAFDVMMRRGWTPTYIGTNDSIPQWVVFEGMERRWDMRVADLDPSPDPFTALVEADRWYRENIEAKQ